MKQVRLLFWFGCMMVLQACSSEGAQTTESKTTAESTTNQVLPDGLQFNGNDALYQEISVQLSVQPQGPWKVGQDVKLSFKTKAIADWHLYSARKDGKIAYNPTEVVLFEEDCRGVRLSGDMAEDKVAQERQDPTLGGLVRDFKDGEVTFSQSLTITDAACKLSGEFAGQVCTDAGVCKFFKFPIEWKFEATP